MQFNMDVREVDNAQGGHEIDDVQGRRYMDDTQGIYEVVGRYFDGEACD